MSRTLDALVAEQVMGKFLHPNLRKYDGYGGGPPMATDGPDAARFPDCDFHCTWGNVPPYSSDLAVAWQVVEKIVAQHQCVHVTGYDGQWHCQIENNITFRGGVCSDVDALLCSAPTAPLAICLAALKAKGIEVPVHDLE